MINDLPLYVKVTIKFYYVSYFYSFIKKTFKSSIKQNKKTYSINWLFFKDWSYIKKKILLRIWRNKKDLFPSFLSKERRVCVCEREWETNCDEWIASVCESNASTRVYTITSGAATTKTTTQVHKNTYFFFKLISIAPWS